MLLVACGSPPPTAPPVACRADCVTPYAATLGANEGVEAYSNCSAACVDPTPNYAAEATYTGIRWQCVEYARRWWLLRRGIVFGSVDTAHDMWAEVKRAARPAGGPDVPVERRPNRGPHPPEVGDLVVFERDACDPEMRFGHVAVVVSVDLKAGSVALAEQNMGNAAWIDPSHHARVLSLAKTPGGYTLGGDHVALGWLHPRL